MGDDLVKRLRRIGTGAHVGAVSDDRKAAREAADRIEMLESMLRRIMGMYHDGGIDDLEARDDATYRNVCIALEVKDD